MTLVLRLLEDVDKRSALSKLCLSARQKHADHRIFECNPRQFSGFPNSSFGYWVSEAVSRAFSFFPALESSDTGLVARRGVNTNDDFRFLRLWTELGPKSSRWRLHPKGGEFSPFYSDVWLAIDWLEEGDYLRAKRVTTKAYDHAIVPSESLYFRPGLTWSRRTKSRLSMRVMPAGCVFGDKGPAIILDEDDEPSLLAIAALCSSSVFHQLLEVQLAAADARPGGAAHSFEVGVLQTTPLPAFTDWQRENLSRLGRAAWSLKRTLDTVEETSHAFALPSDLRGRLGDYDPLAIETNLNQIQAEIDDIAFDLYGVEGKRRVAAQTVSNSGESAAAEAGEHQVGEINAPDQVDSLLSWAVGVAFGRFDWRLATGEREEPPEPEPFDPLPDISSGMLPDGDDPFLAHSGILVDDIGHEFDLARVVEEVLSKVDALVEADVRRWLRRSFFPAHLKQYSKSRRKAPIYWPLGTPSGEYTLWLYYPELNSQTLYTAVNDFVEPKLHQVEADLAALRAKGRDRSKKEDRALERLETLEQELAALRTSLLEIAPSYKPHHDDGVQITAAPLADLFQHRPWQNVLKDTWKMLEDGDYDWAQLALEYWPERVREKCKIDRSLAIAHGLEYLYEGDQ